VSGFRHRRRDGKPGHEGLKLWQARMAVRGWDITPDGRYGDETAEVAEAFQREKGLTVDGLIGPETYAAAWEASWTA
jgi:peptidoglycan hydrolase-like protein with peptidoglycan-binding domain